MERLVEESQSSTADEVMHEMKALPSSQEPKLQCQVQPQHSKKYTGDKWLLGVVALVLAVVMVLLIVLVFMCGFMMSQSSLSATTQALVQESIEKLALLVDIAREISRNVNNIQINEILSLITNVTHINNELAWDHAKALSLVENLLNNNTDLLKTFAASNSDSLTNIVNTLSNLQDTSASTAGVVDGLLIVVQELLQIHNVSFSLPTSCKQIRYEKPSSPSGLYLLTTANSRTINAYCNMEELCGSGGGWTRLAYLDMSDSTVNCPSGFRLYQSGEVRACGRPVTSSGSCVSVQFPSNGISYSQVCGRVTGYQYSAPDAVSIHHGSNQDNLNSYYVDGVSITRGSPRQHIWTLMAANYEMHSIGTLSCPCATGSTLQVQSFIGDNYFCESGVAGLLEQQLYTSDPLWDGQSCGTLESPCCNVPGIPWFHRDYGNTTTTDYIELRVCGDEGTSNEDTPVSYYEIYVKFCVEVTKDTASNIPNHTICLRSVFTVTNLLPYGFHFSFKSKEKLIPSGKEVAIHNVNSLRPVTFSISKLESFEFSDKCTVSITEVGVVKSLIVRDKANCSLNLHVNTELMSKGSLKVVIWCPYWLINRTSLPLVFTSQGDSSGGKCAGQFEEHETATSMSPLLFSYSEDDLLQKCQVRLGRGQDEGVPSWSNGFRMLRDEDVLRLFVKRGQGRPDKEYQIGMEVKKGTGVYKPTKVVTFVARFQLENRTTFNLKYLQRHLVFAKDESSSDSVPVIAPGAVMAFHWPRADLDQLLCIRVVELSDCHWSGGFPLEQDKSFHINMRCSYGRSVFIRCEVILRGATYHVIFSDASDYPPPFKLENLSQIAVICYQQSVTSQQQYTVLNPGQSVPYAWDEVTLPEKLCLHIKDVSEPRPFDLSSFGPQGKVYYESYFYIVAMDTKTDQSHLPESHRLEGELVLDVPQGRAVLLTRKGLERRTQLWRMTARGQLVHISSSSSKSANFVLDLAGSVPPNYRHSNRPLPLVISRANERRSSTQSWEFKNGRLVLSSYPHLCVQVRHGYEGKVDGMDAVVGCVGSGDKEELRRLKKSPGSGVLSVSLVPDGPTRVLRITDESKKYTISGATDDWIIVEHGLIAPALSSSTVELTNEETDVKTELSVSFTLEKGVSVSLINSTPEELLLATVTGVRIEFVSTAVHQCINATIQYIQVDNQMHNGFHQIVLFPTPPPSGELDTNFPVISCFIERLPHNSPLATVFRVS
uniref:Vacuolar protein sorting-associated protein 13 VPS13 adaptor binding domain-containing protein n=1 Tax=Amphimedon queenslandica TaxID=400682 RepID=A0A1X7TNH4_AMPQE